MAAVLLRRRDEHAARGEPRPAPRVSAAVDEPLCSRCSQPVSAKAATGRPGDQLAAERIECPNCGASLARDVEGHLDRG